MSSDLKSLIKPDTAIKSVHMHVVMSDQLPDLAIDPLESVRRWTNL